MLPLETRVVTLTFTAGGTASAGLSASASTPFAAALRALDAEPLPVIVAADAVQRPPSIDPRETVTREADKKAVAIY